MMLAGLVLVASCATRPPVQDSTWYWLGSVLSLSPMQPAEPESYTLQFDDGRAAIRADCNRANGAVTLDGDKARFGPMAMTRRACLPGSLGEKYAAQFQSARRLSVADGVLRIELEDSEDVMFFTADPKARLALYRCRGQKMLNVLFAGDTAQVWYDGAHYALARERSASGARYAGGGAMFDTQGVMGSLRKGDRVLAQNCQLPSR